MPCICGSATLAIVLSTPCMIVASMIEAVIAARLRGAPLSSPFTAGLWSSSGALSGRLSFAAGGALLQGNHGESHGDAPPPARRRISAYHEIGVAAAALRAAQA